MDLTSEIAKELLPSSELPNFKAGDSITVFYKIKEGDKERIQFFKGDVLQRRGSGATETFTIRKISNSIAVERIFPLNSPSIDRIEINRITIIDNSRTPRGQPYTPRGHQRAMSQQNMSNSNNPTRTPRT